MENEFISLADFLKSTPRPSLRASIKHRAIVEGETNSGVEDLYRRAFLEGIFNRTTT